MNYSPLDIWNPGVLDGRLPSHLFQKLKNNCLNGFVKEKYNHSTIARVDKVLYYPHERDPELSSFLCQTFEAYHRMFNFEPSIMRNNKPRLHDMWVNFQKKNQYIPNHKHAGHLAFVIWVQIPYDLKKEMETDAETRRDTAPQKAAFELTYSTINNDVIMKTILISKEDEGRILMFPSSLVHCVYPFTTSNGIRISVSGNLLFERRV
jgi:hypothetical protein